MNFVLDTSVLIDHLRGGNVFKEFSDEIEEYSTQLFLPTIVLFELFSGTSSKNSNIVTKIYQLTRDFERMALNEEIAKKAGELYRDVTKELEVPDYIVAASALSIGATVVTLNKKHFEQIQNLPIYPI